MQVFNHATFQGNTELQKVLPDALYQDVFNICCEIMDLEKDGSLPSEFEYNIVIIDLDDYTSYDAIVIDPDLPAQVLSSWVRDAGYENYEYYDNCVSSTTVVTDDYGSGYCLILLNDTIQDESILRNFLEAAQNIEA